MFACRFHGPTVKECIHSVLLDELANKSYNHEMVATWTTEIANILKDKVKGIKVTMKVILCFTKKLRQTGTNIIREGQLVHIR